MNKFLKREAGGFPGSLVVKNPPANAGDAGSTHGSGRSPGEGNGNSLPNILTWEIPRAEEPGCLQFMGSQRDGHDLVTITTATSFN